MLSKQLSELTLQSGSSCFSLGASRISSSIFFFPEIKAACSIARSAEVATTHRFPSGGCTSHASHWVFMYACALCVSVCVCVCARTMIPSGCHQLPESMSCWQLGAAGWLENSCSRAEKELIRARGQKKWRTSTVRIMLLLAGTSNVSLRFCFWMRDPHWNKRHVTVTTTALLCHF